MRLEVSFSSFTPTMSSELETKDGEDALAKMMEASLDVSDEGAETNEPPSAAPATPEVAKASAKAGEAAVRKSTPAAPAATSAPKPAIQVCFSLMGLQGVCTRAGTRLGAMGFSLSLTLLPGK